MENKYNRAIEHVEVTAEMHNRILKNIGEVLTNKQNKTPSFRPYGRYIAVAACFVFLLVGAFLIFNALTNKPPIVVKPPEIVECISIDELSDAVEFQVREVKRFPFVIEHTEYTAYLRELSIAQIKYTGENNTLIFRMSAGSEDNSGDYNEYSNVGNNSVDDLTVTIKGNRGRYNLAIWQDGGYSYSVSFAYGITEEEILGIILSVQ